MSRTGDDVGGLEQLVARVQAGDRGAESEVVTRFGRGLAIILERHTNGRPEAEDLFQDTFRIGLEKLRRGELRDPVKLPGFLSRIARNLAIEHYRKAQRRQTLANSDTVDHVATLPSRQLGDLVRRENAIFVRRVLEELGNERDRQILFRFYIAEEDKDSIAEELGLSSLQFNRVLYRARQRYKMLLEREGMGASGREAVAVALLLFSSSFFDGLEGSELEAAINALLVTLA